MTLAPDKTPVSDYLRTLRSEKGLSQRDLASQLGVSQMTISYWERGRPPSLASLARIAEETLSDRDKHTFRALMMRSLEALS